MNRFHSFLALPLLALAAGAANAAEVSDTFDVSVTIQSTCSIDTQTAGNIDFGSPKSDRTDIDSTGTLSITCTPGTSYTVALGDGTNNSGAGTDGRRMEGDGKFVPYQLYSDSSRTSVWGSTSGTVGGVGSGAAQDLTVYGRIPSANFPAGTYTDTVIATVEY